MVLPRVMWGCVTLRVLSWRYCLVIKVINKYSYRETCFWNQHQAFSAQSSDSSYLPEAPGAS